MRAQNEKEYKEKELREGRENTFFWFLFSIESSVCRLSQQLAIVWILVE